MLLGPTQQFFISQEPDENQNLVRFIPPKSEKSHLEELSERHSWDDFPTQKSTGKSPKLESFDDENVPPSPKLELYENEFVPLQQPPPLYSDNTVNKPF